jgi:hypothetical protein
MLTSSFARCICVDYKSLSNAILSSIMDVTISLKRFENGYNVVLLHVTSCDMRNSDRHVKFGGMAHKLDR